MRPPGEEPLSHRNAAEVQALQGPWPVALSENQFGAAAADVENQAQPLVRRQAVRDSVIDEPRFLDTRDDFDRMAQCGLGLRHKSEIFVRAPDRTGACCPYAGRMHVAQSLTEYGEAMQGPGTGISRKVACCRESLGQPHGFTNTIDNSELPMPQFAHDHVKTVGTKVNGRDDFGSVGVRRIVGEALVAGSSYLFRPVWTLYGKRTTASASGLGIRISNDELCALQIFLVVDLGAHQVLHAHWVNQ